MHRSACDETLRITSLGIQTPFADLYPGALDALGRRVHAHALTGGAWSWAAAQPMDSTGRILGLSVREGALWGYSVESRNTTISSNARGHLALHVTDHARSPDAFGGQPVIELSAGAEYVLSGEIGWHDDMSTFAAATPTPARFSSFSATVGDVITVHADSEVRSATCVFVMPTSVDGVSAHAADPLANDQDFHLAMWMQLEADGHASFV